jgi:hypothetical protein
LREGSRGQGQREPILCRSHTGILSQIATDAAVRRMLDMAVPVSETNENTHPQGWLGLAWRLEGLCGDRQTRRTARFHGVSPPPGRYFSGCPLCVSYQRARPGFR